MIGSQHISPAPQSPQPHQPQSPDPDPPANHSAAESLSPSTRRAHKHVEAPTEEEHAAPDSEKKEGEREAGSLLCTASAASDNLPVGWKVHHNPGRSDLCYVTPDGATLGSLQEATSYLEQKPISAEGKASILASLDFSSAMAGRIA
eukprot:CAMPEP_0181288844 /NCGR_PEP_ID=MMETSP1101-20121128/559_1 /TAXON_ID=46948 /ORGANISM="Rhodomonas abbreviata, Strain Caron Lab Isolate" /LENGTH=146 /DNA_ID=CAMNT_0023393013 /DNA_START=38 /DNA_END=474 /DNA_ORIENTATION=+